MSFSKIKKILFGVSQNEVTFKFRQFQGGTKKTIERIEIIGTTFINGYHAALDSTSTFELNEKLITVTQELQGFAFEGAGMGLSLLDYLTPWNKNRFNSFLNEFGSKHYYMMYVGFGWAIARIPFHSQSQFNHLDPLYRWLAIDGYGFHEGYFNWKKYHGKSYRPKKIKGYAIKAFDQGLGRSLWFSKGANIDLINKTINTFDMCRHSDLWSGIGLAATYANGTNFNDLLKLNAIAKHFKPELAQGASFAAKARLRAGNLVPHTDEACNIFCNSSADCAAAITDKALNDLKNYNQQEEPTYELWRKNIRSHYVNQ